MADESLQSPAYRVEAVSPDKDGRLLFVKVWYLYFQKLGTLLGVNPTAEDLGQGPPDLTGVASLEQRFETFRQEIDQRPLADVYSGVASSVDDQAPPTYSQLVAEVAELRKIVEGLQQASIVL